MWIDIIDAIGGQEADAIGGQEADAIGGIDEGDAIGGIDEADAIDIIDEQEGIAGVGGIEEGQGADGGRVDAMDCEEVVEISESGQKRNVF